MPSTKNNFHLIWMCEDLRISSWELLNHDLTDTSLLNRVFGFETDLTCVTLVNWKMLNIALTAYSFILSGCRACWHVARNTAPSVPCAIISLTSKSTSCWKMNKQENFFVNEHVCIHNQQSRAETNSCPYLRKLHAIGAQANCSQLCAPLQV